MRKYERIWCAVKANQTASLKANPSLHKRIIKAVTKEKSQDDVWNLIQNQYGCKKKLYHKIDGELLIFTLEETNQLNLL